MTLRTAVITDTMTLLTRSREEFRVVEQLRVCVEGDLRRQDRRWVGERLVGRRQRGDEQPVNGQQAEDAEDRDDDPGPARGGAAAAPAGSAPLRPAGWCSGGGVSSDGLVSRVAEPHVHDDEQQQQGHPDQPDGAGPAEVRAP